MNHAGRKKDSSRKDAALEITIPANLTACQALIEQLACTVDSLTSANETLRQEKQDIELAFNLWMRRIFAKRSERYLNDPNQLKLDLGEDDAAADAAEGLAQAVEEAGLPVKAHVRRVRKPRKESLPENLPRYEVEASVPDDVKNCPAHGPRTVIGYDTTETLEFERPKLRVRVTKYAKYACSNHTNCGIASPERPTGLVTARPLCGRRSIRHFRGRRDHHGQVRLPSSDIPAAGYVCRKRLDAGAFDAVEHPDGRSLRD